MRKYLLIILLIIIAIVFIWIACFGVSIGKFKINSYSEIIAMNNEKKELLAQLDNKNTKEFEKKKKTLNAAVSEYKTTKKEYDKLVAEGKITEDSIINTIELFDINSLWEKFLVSATTKNIKLQLDVTKSTTSTSISSKYIMGDLKFSIVGEYIPVTDFLLDIENDDTLNFEIRDFSVKEVDEGFEATFIVRDIPLDTQSLATSEEENLFSSKN